MPYKVRRDSSCPDTRPWAVVKDDGSGKVMGCHETMEKAERQRAAIEANERDER